MIRILSVIDILLGLTILLGVSNIFSGWQLTMDGSFGTTHEFNGQALLFLLGLSILIGGIILAFITGWPIKSRRG
jgi:hypothetical protein